MNLDPADNPLREKIWRRDLTPAEQAELRAWLARHPEAQSAWADEANLNRLLDRLPDAPVPSNFTARVLDAVQREERVQSRSKSRAWWTRVFIPRAAVAAVIVSGIGLFGSYYAQRQERRKFAESLVRATEVKSTPPVQTLEDFEAIRRASIKPVADEELISLLAKMQ
jgi:anti-sigma factor RsiW